MADTTITTNLPSRISVFTVIDGVDYFLGTTYTAASWGGAREVLVTSLPAGWPVLPVNDGTDSTAAITEFGKLVVDAAELHGFAQALLNKVDLHCFAETMDMNHTA